MNQTEIRQVCSELKILPSKSLGQNFLIDTNIARIIIEAADLTSRDTVLEIGAGFGALTAPLVTQAGRVVAVERDRRLEEFLCARFGAKKKIKLIFADALAVDYQKTAGLRNLSYKLVSNLPYSMGTRLLLHLVEKGPHPNKIVVTIQREVAQRLAASPGSKDYGAASVLAQLFYSVRLAHRVSPTCFWPVPRVESAVVVMDWFPHPRLKLKRAGEVLRLVRAGFGQRRKMLRGRLQALGISSEILDDAFRQLGIAFAARSEELSVEKWIQLAHATAAQK